MKKIEQIPDDFIKTWCEKFKKEMKCDHLSNKDAKTFMFLAMNEKNLEDNEEFIKDMNSVFIINVITKRLVMYHYTMSLAAKCALGLIFDNDSLGNNTMNMTYLEYLTKRNNKTHIDMNFIGLNAFPSGIPTEKFMNMMWDEQKCTNERDNILDYKYFIDKMWEDIK